MTSSRRSFLKQTSVAVSGALFLPNLLLAGRAKKEIVGIQLYSVRDEMKTDPTGTLQALAKMGYRHVEHANYSDRKFYGYSATEFKKVLDGLGLQMPSGHTVLGSRHWDEASQDFTAAWKHTVEDAAVVGQELVISPSMDEKARHNYDDLMRLLERFNKSGELCRQAGMKFGYHNHAFEFTTRMNGQTMYDIILKNTDPALVIQQLDMGNMYNAGAKAAAIIQRYPGRFLSLHVKDEIKSARSGPGDQYESTILGAGVIGVEEVLRLAKTSGGTEHFIVEQEAYQGHRPLSCMEANLAVMNKWGYKA